MGPGLALSRMGTPQGPAVSLAPGRRPPAFAARSGPSAVLATHPELSPCLSFPHRKVGAGAAVSWPLVTPVGVFCKLATHAHVVVTWTPAGTWAWNVG